MWICSNIVNGFILITLCTIVLNMVTSYAQGTCFINAHYEKQVNHNI